MNNTWTLLLLLLSAGLMIWFMVRTVRGNPQAFSKDNLNKSFYTLGILTLIIIAVIFIGVILIK